MSASAMGGWKRRLVRAALLTSPFFGVPIVALLLNQAGAISLDVRIEFYKMHILMLLVYWVAATPVAALVLNPRAAADVLIRARRKLIAAFLSLVIVTIAAEYALTKLQVRAAARTNRMMRSERFEHKNTPNFDGPGGNGTNIRTNADGFRTDRSREEFLDHTIRIAALGDSYLFGVGVPGEMTVAPVIERALRRELQRTDVAVVNTGVISYSPIIERSLFREVVSQYRPHVTLLFLDCNDIADDYKYAGLSISGDPDRPVFPTPDRLVDWNQFSVTRLARPVIETLAAPVRLFERMFTDRQMLRDYYEFRIEVGGVVERDHWFILRHPLEETRPYFERTLEYVKDIAAEAEAVGSRFVLIVSARYFHWSDRECRDNRVGFRYADDEPHEFAYIEFFDSIIDQVPFPVLPLLPIFQETEEFPIVFSFDPHWNETGHAVVGEAVADFLLQNDLIPNDG